MSGSKFPDRPEHNLRDGPVSESAVLAARFWQKVNIEDSNECWEWAGTTMKAGYGQLTVEGERYYTHRLVYRLTHGEIPQEQINHHCANKLCVNPTHVYSGSQSDNMKDAYENNPAMREGLEPHQGSNCYASKLDESDVFEIKQRLANSEPKTHIAEDYPVTNSTIGMIDKGKIWTHVKCHE